MEQRFGPYLVGETLGRGNFAKVKVAVHEGTKQKVALKVISRKALQDDPKSEMKIKREIRILRLLKHPHIMRMYDVIQTRSDIVLVLEFVSGGELFDYLSRRGRLEEPHARLFFQQIVSGMLYCHSYHIAHRDLKPENIMLENNNTSVKIGDFGLSSIMREGKLFQTSCGTPNYAAPEVVNGRLYGGQEADAWSCGVVLFTMLCGRLPFDDDHVHVLFKKISKASYQMPNFVSPMAQDLLHRLLVVDPLERATLAQVRQHPWVSDEFPLYLSKLELSLGREHEVDRTIDPEVLADVAKRFKMSEESVKTAVEREQAKANAVEEASLNKEATAPPNSVLGMGGEVPIPDADVALRNEEHDLLVAYTVLLDRKRYSTLLETDKDTSGRGPSTGGVAFQNPFASIPPVQMTSRSVEFGSLSALGGTTRRKDNPNPAGMFGLPPVPDNSKVTVERPITTAEYNAVIPNPHIFLNSSDFLQHDKKTAAGGNGGSGAPAAAVVAASAPESPSASPTAVEGDAAKDPSVPFRLGIMIGDCSGQLCMVLIYKCLVEHCMVWKTVCPFGLVAVCQEPPTKVFVYVMRVGDGASYMVDIRLSRSSFNLPALDVVFSMYNHLMKNRRMIAR